MPPRYDQGYGPARISFGGPLTTAVKWLLIANVAVYILQIFIYGIGGEEAWQVTLTLFALNPILVFKKLFVWQLVTYMFMHSPDYYTHILLNMLILWMFGCDIERIWGPRKFLRYYMLTGIGGGLLNCAFSFRSQTLGASGAVFGIIVAYGMLFPTRRIWFWGLFPITARTFAMLLALIELLSLGAFKPDGIAHFAHLGGALTGYLLLKGTWSPRRLFDELRWKMRRRRFRTIEDDWKRSDRDRRYPYH